MNITETTLLKSYVDTEEFPLVICGMDYRIKYMNILALEQYEKYGGTKLLGRLLTSLMDEEAKSKVDMVIEWFKEDISHNRMLAVRDNREKTDIYMCALRDETGGLIGFCSRHRSRRSDNGTPYSTID
ncbi:MAG TPA: hypothetical protein PLH98_10090 [Ruminococcus flavefaciens]|nr:hypothetical protein [Ruminococcus flavefaciens]HQM00886.1 hypothetical protein [Ruminococcus flavefaciens]